MTSTPIERTGAGGGSLSAYLTGYLFSIVLTLAAFGMVVSGAFSETAAQAGIFAAAVAQIAVHLHYFLHMDSRSAARWNVMAFLLTLLIMILFIGGTLWIMDHLKARLM